MEVRQASSGVVNSATRVAMAREKARALGLKARRPSPLEQAAAKLESKRESKVRKTEEERLKVSRKVEAHPFFLQQVALQAKVSEAGDELGWKAYIPPKREAKRRRTRLGGIAVGSFATRLIQRERGRGGRVVTDPRARALEEAARRWEARQTKRNPRG